MPKLNDLLAQKAKLDKQIAQVQQEQRGTAIAQVKALMAENGLSVADLGRRGVAKGPRAGKKVAAKYRNKATGDTWSGRGLQPRWLKAELKSGKKLADFAV